MAFKTKMVIALIPARGGSKGVKRKNLRTLFGKPLLVHTIQAALDSCRVDMIYVSSENSKILQIANKYRVKTVKRSLAAASDMALANDVVMEFILGLPKSIISENPFLVYLQPSSPLRSGHHIDAAFACMNSKKTDVCLSVSLAKQNLFKSFLLTKNKTLKPLFCEAATNKNRQSFPDVYCPNGAIYIFPVKKFLKYGRFPSKGGLPYIMSFKESIDIDSEEDFAIIEALCSPK